MQLMKNTIQKLLSNNKWGLNNYIDEQDRERKLKQELRGTKIVTIYGEGGFGKTELVYQTLKGSLKMRIKHYALMNFYPSRSKEQNKGSIP